MYFSSFAEFIAMGGHGLYVWSVFGIALVFIVALLAAPMNAKKRFFKQERQRQLRDSQTTVNKVNS